MKKNMLLGAVLVSATLIATAGSTQVSTVPSSAVGANSVQGSCVAMMQGWESDSSVDSPADVSQITFRNTSRNRMVALTKKRDGQYWMVADLKSGESVTRARMNSNTRVAWAIHGGRHHCVKSFTIGRNQTHTF